jgi:hypothetical protein
VDGTKLILTEIDHDPKTERGMRRTERCRGREEGVDLSHTQFLSDPNFFFFISSEAEVSQYPIYTVKRSGELPGRRIAK